MTTHQPNVPATDEEIAALSEILSDITPLPWHAKKVLLGYGLHSRDNTIALSTLPPSGPFDLNAIAKVMNSAPDLLARIESDRAKIGEMEKVLGPKMACGCYAVEMRCSRGITFCTHHQRGTAVTPEYLQWKATR